MKVWYDGSTPTIQAGYGVTLVPGENTLEPDVAEALLKCGLVRHLPSKGKAAKTAGGE